jgi:hypothetical protein
MERSLTVSKSPGPARRAKTGERRSDFLTGAAKVPVLITKFFDEQLKKIT